MHKRIPPVLVLLAASLAATAQTEKTYRVDLSYQAPRNGVRPNFSPYGTHVTLVPWPAGAPLPEGAMSPAATGFVQVGPNRNSWIRVLTTADSDHPRDYCRLYIDRNRNGSFTDDGPPLTTKPIMNGKTQAWWS